MSKRTVTLRVVIEARGKRQVEDMIEAVARSVCDIANSYDGVHIYVEELNRSTLAGEDGPQHPDDLAYPQSDWQYEVANRYTELNYADWVAHSRERDQ
jgi:hypothetical protein